MKMLQRYSMGDHWNCFVEDDDGELCMSRDVDELEAMYAELVANNAAVCAHMMRMFYALVNFTNPMPDDDAAEVMAEAKQAVELYLNDSSTVVTDLKNHD